MRRRTRTAPLLGAVALVIALGSAPTARADDPFEVRPGDAVQGELVSRDARHCVHIDLPAGTRLKAKLRRDDDEDLALQLAVRGPDCASFNVTDWLREKSDGRKVTLRSFPVPLSGVWRLVARTGDFRTGRYVLTTKPKHETSFRHEGEITTDAQEASFEFPGPEGATVKLTIKGRGEGDLLPRVLEVRGPDGLPLTLPPATGTGRKIKVRGLRLPATGDYVVLLAGRDDTTGSFKAKVSIDPQPRETVMHEYDGPPTGCCEDDPGGPDPEDFTISSSLIGPAVETIPVGTTVVRAVTMSLYAREGTTISWFRLRSYGRDEDVRAVRLYWDNDRFYDEDDPGHLIAGGLKTFVNGSLDLNVEVPLPAFAARYLHVVLDLEPDLPVGRDVGVRIPSGGVELSSGIWNGASRPPHDPGPIRIVAKQTTFRWQDISKISGDGAPTGDGHLVVRAGRKVILFPAVMTPFRNVYQLDLDFLGAGWKLVAATGGLPPKRWGACGVYDPDGDRLVMFGGRNGTGSTDTVLGDVWELDLSQNPPVWTDLTPSSGAAPVARVLASAVLDTTRRRMIVFGGHDFGSIIKSDAWAWDLKTDRWESTALDVKGTVPWNGQGLTGHLAVYDPKHDRMVVTGGSPTSPRSREFTTNGTRTYFLEFADSPDQNNWKNVVSWTGDAPAGRIQGVTAFDGVRMIVHGGSMKRLATGLTDFLMDTWTVDLAEQNPGEWTRIHPGGDDDPRARGGHGAAWDPETMAVVLYGGASSLGALRETWFLREELK